ncbi:MAG: citrate synthase [Acidimicrobiia bacterium]|nr:citrate synthase [Acidimicrobiia bacterium]
MGDIDDKVVLRHGSEELELPLVRGTEGEVGIDIEQLRKRTGLVTIDRGYVNTASCESAITYIDGEKGILRYRGYDITELAEHGSFLETAYLLIWGDLPTEHQLAVFRTGIRKHTLLHEDMKQFFRAFPKEAHPMGILSSVVSAMSTFYADAQVEYPTPDVTKLSIIRLMAKLPTIAAYAYKKSIGQPFIYPNNSLDLIQNFLTMMFAVPSEPYHVDDEIVTALKKLLILHADHEQNCSTSTVRLVGSSHANVYASVAAGINALWGPLHGGANQAVIEMLEEIRADGDVAKFVRMAKDPDEPFRLMGFGHRVYKNYDPRARIIKEQAHKVLDRLGRKDELLDLALELEETALSDPYFVERRLYPNVDFYSGLIYRAMGFPVQMFPVLFALGRLPGWIAQWLEMMEDPNQRIGRPRQIYIGETERPYTALADRG